MKSKKIRYFKFLARGHEGPFTGFEYKYYLPMDGKPGFWLPKVYRISLCESGYHACNARDALYWYDMELYEVELRGKIHGSSNNKVVAQQVRFLRRIKGYSLTKMERMDDEYYNADDDTEGEKVLDKLETYILKLADKSK